MCLKAKLDGAPQRPREIIIEVAAIVAATPRLPRWQLQTSELK
jgi:hypothetical protein